MIPQEEGFLSSFEHRIKRLWEAREKEYASHHDPGFLSGFLGSDGHIHYNTHHTLPNAERALRQMLQTGKAVDVDLTMIAPLDRPRPEPYIPTAHSEHVARMR